MNGPAMPADVAAWIYTNVIASYHWEDWPTMPANERWPECEPSGMGQESPVPAEVCFCVRRMCTLVGPGRIHRDWSRGYPFRHHFVWLAHARDPIRLADHARRQEETDVEDASVARSRLLTPAESAGCRPDHDPLTDEDIRDVAARWYIGWRRELLLDPDSHLHADPRPADCSTGGLGGPGRLLWVSAVTTRNGVWAHVKQHCADGTVAYERSGRIPWRALEEAGRALFQPAPEPVAVPVVGGVQLDLFAEVTG